MPRHHIRPCGVDDDATEAGAVRGSIAGPPPGTRPSAGLGRRALVVPLALLALVLAGCGGDDDDQGATTSTSVDTSDDATTTSVADDGATSTTAAEATTTSTPTDTTDDATTTTAVAEEVALVLEPDGIGTIETATGSTNHLTFDTDMATVDDVASTVLGGTAEQQAVDECPAGPAETYRYDNGLSLVAQDGTFVGWSIGPGGDQDLTTLAGIGLGSTVAEVRDVIADVTVEETSLGYEMSAGGFGAVVDGDTDDAVITDLWAGTVCIFR